MTEHLETKHKLQDDIKTFDDMMKCQYLSDEDKDLAMRIYIKNQDFMSISEDYGVSERTVIRKHKKLLIKISKILKARI